MNTAAGHESSGEAGKIHCSRATYEELIKRLPDSFAMVERGRMKGKGEQQLAFKN